MPLKRHELLSVGRLIKSDNVSRYTKYKNYVIQPLRFAIFYLLEDLGEKSKRYFDVFGHIFRTLYILYIFIYYIYTCRSLFVPLEFVPLKRPEFVARESA